MLDYVDQVTEQFKIVEKTFRSLVAEFNETNAKVLSNLKILKLEKNEAKRELENRNEVVIQENFDSASI